MTTDAAPNLETRLQRWLSESMTAWKRDNKWLLTHSDEAASLLKHQQAELTACCAEQARLQARCSMLEDAAFHFQSCRTCAEDGEGNCFEGRKFAAFLRGEVVNDD